MAHQYGIGSVGIERAVGFIDQRVIGQDGTTLQRQRLREVHGLWSNDAYGFHLEPKIKKAREHLAGRAGFGESIRARFSRIYQGESLAPAS